MHQLLESYERKNGTDTPTCNDILNGLSTENKVRALGIRDSEGTPASHIDHLYMDQLFR